MSCSVSALQVMLHLMLSGLPVDLVVDGLILVFDLDLDFAFAFAFA